MTGSSGGAGKKDLGRDPLFWLVAIVTTLMWAAAGVDSLITAQFSAFEIATGPYLIVVGFLTGVKVIRLPRNGGGGGAAE